MKKIKFPILRTLTRRIAMIVLLGLLFAAHAPAEDSESLNGPLGSIKFVGQNTFATANGQFHVWRVVERSAPGTPAAESWALIEVDLASVDTGIKRRDDHLRDPDFFEVTTWPVASVRAHSLEALRDDRYAARFDIDLHGVQKTLEGEVTLVSESPVVFEGNLVINRLDFGVGAPPSRWNPMSIDAEIPIRFRIEL